MRNYGPVIIYTDIGIFKEKLIPGWIDSDVLLLKLVERYIGSWAAPLHMTLSYI